MESEIRFDKGTQWLIAVAISVGLHVLILIAFAMTGGDSLSALQKGAEAVEEPASQASRTESEEKKPEPEKKPAPEAKPAPAVQPAAPAKPVPAARPAPKAAPEPMQKPEPEEEAYVVKKGDSLSSIAKECGSSLSELLKLNGSTLKKMSNLRVGQRIKVPRKR